MKYNKKKTKHNYSTHYLHKGGPLRFGVRVPSVSITHYMRDKKSAAMFLLPGRYLNTKLNSCKANAQRASLALLGAASVKKARGLWSEKIVILDRNTHARNLLRAQMTAYASLSIVAHRV